MWGTYPIRWNTGAGMFRCPGEGVERHYQLKAFIRFFHLMFIPLIPFERGSYVQCQACKAKFKPEVLQVPLASVGAQFVGPGFPQPGFPQPVFGSGMPMPMIMPMAMPVAIAPATPPPIAQLSDAQLNSQAMTEMIRGVNIAVLRGGGATAMGREIAIGNIRTRMQTYDEADLAADFKHLDLSCLDTYVQRVLPTLSRETLGSIVAAVARVASTAEEANKEKSLAMLQTVAARLGLSDDDLVALVVGSGQPILA